MQRRDRDQPRGDTGHHSPHTADPGEKHRRSACREGEIVATAMPLRPREVHQRAYGRQKIGRGILRPLSEGSVPDLGRELASFAIGKHRIHDEAATGAD